MSDDDDYPFGRQEAFDLSEPSNDEKDKVGNDIVGLHLEDAQQIYPDEKVREAIKDGKELSLEDDLRPDRVNVETRDGKIIKLLNWG